MIRLMKENYRIKFPRKSKLNAYNGTNLQILLVKINF